MVYIADLDVIECYLKVVSMKNVTQKISRIKLYPNLFLP